MHLLISRSVCHKQSSNWRYFIGMTPKGWLSVHSRMQRSEFKCVVVVWQVEMHSQEGLAQADLTARGGRNGSKKKTERSHTPASEGTKSGSEGSPKTPQQDALQAAKNQAASQEARRQAELQAKFDKTEVQRHRDRQGITERLERNKGMRDERFNRLVEH
eukprot:4488020-Amphidinium_carterae.1